MNQRAHTLVGLIIGMASFSVSPARSAETPVQLQLDTETTLGGIGVACTGIGSSKDDPRWSAYPVRVEFANPEHEYIIGAIVTISDMKKAPIVTVSCPGPWLLLKLPDRSSYRLDAYLSDVSTPPQSRVVKAPAQGQIRVVLTFPET